MGYIYKITNDINGKVYIGQTVRPVWKRWINHVYQATHKEKSSCPHLHRAIRKYGVDSFTCEPIVEASDMVLDDLERYWINYYDSTNTGYNITVGGKNGCRTTDDKIILEKWNSGMTIREISKCTHHAKGTIAERLRALGVSKEQALERGWNIGSRKACIPVYQYDLQGNFIREFSSITEANKFLGRKNAVGQVIRGVLLQTDGYQWKTYKADKIDPYNPAKAQRRSVAKLADDGTILEVFQKIKDAAASVNSCHANIIRACQKPWKTCGGYKWKYI